jgi:hypothetical protein
VAQTWPKRARRASVRAATRSGACFELVQYLQAFVVTRCRLPRSPTRSTEPKVGSSNLSGRVIEAALCGAFSLLPDLPRFLGATRRTSSPTRYRSNSAASELSLPRFGLRIVRAMQPSPCARRDGCVRGRLSENSQVVAALPHIGVISLLRWDRAFNNPARRGSISHIGVLALDIPTASWRSARERRHRRTSPSSREHSQVGARSYRKASRAELGSISGG